MTALHLAVSDTNKRCPVVYTLKALTDIWTGDAQRRGDRLIPTGLLGSIRWWFEVLVRGLGGKACDPTVDGVRCPDANKEPHEAGHHCVVCELFGCTGWARKFRLTVVDDQGNSLQGQIKPNQTFTLRFIPLRPIADEEWCLLDATLRLIADYGAIGGKTVFKPSDEPRFHHKDFGLIEVQPIPDRTACKRQDLEQYVRATRWRQPADADYSWASLANFWCVKGRYLARQDRDTSSFNFVIGDQSRRTNRRKAILGWLERGLIGNEALNQKAKRFSASSTHK